VAETTAVISSVGQGLIHLLMARAGFAAGEVTLRSPADSGQTGKISLFLYQVQESPHLRNSPPEIVGENGMKPPPLTLDLTYLATPLVAEPETALGHLEAVMRAFYDHPVLNSPPLPVGLFEALAETGNEAVRITPRALSLEEASQIWGMFQGKSYQLSVAYWVSPVKIPSVRTVPFTRVVETVARFSRIGGAS